MIVEGPPDHVDALACLALDMVGVVADLKVCTTGRCCFGSVRRPGPVVAGAVAPHPALPRQAGRFVGVPTPYP